MTTIEDYPIIFDLHIKPTYACCIQQRNPNNYFRSEKLERTKDNLKNNKHSGEMSRKAQGRIKNAINWLVSSANYKYVYVKGIDKRVKFKVNFITLTLPTTQHSISDNFFKKVLLHTFLNNCRYQYNLKNFVWKVEAQENGNIHAHITTDVFIHYLDVRKIWNRILLKKGLIDNYTAKHKNLSFEDYTYLYDPKGAKDKIQMRKAFDYGMATNWTDPNTTDIHSVNKINNLGSYLAKYFAKNDDDRRKIKGRLWSCSYNLSESNKLIVELCDNQDRVYLDSLNVPQVKYKEIISEANALGETYKIGSLYLFKIADWGTYIKGPLLDAFNEHRFNIRHNIQKAPPVQIAPQADEALIYNDEDRRIIVKEKVLDLFDN
jgi:hypothetical protein